MMFFILDKLHMVQLIKRLEVFWLAICFSLVWGCSRGMVCGDIFISLKRRMYS